MNRNSMYKSHQKSRKLPSQAISSRYENNYSSLISYILCVPIFLLIGYLSVSSIPILHDPSSPNSSNPSSHLNQSNIIGRALIRTKHIKPLSCLYTAVLGFSYHFLDVYYSSYSRVLISFSNLLRCFGGFIGVNYLVFKAEFPSYDRLAIISISLYFIIWVAFDRSIHGLLFSYSSTMVATWIVYCSNVNFLSSSDPKDQYILMFHLPLLLFSYVILISAISRILLRPTSQTAN
ncbi:hypothetical protein BB560_003722 [Smittium megazygosporum]|uniref:Uncharacterized protein n=1 Tax=Smittium megazygosporum TaxID=133381 RepID=A0A2T9ZB76_9FUNG|nr:hypothetical protein BB560_003722 [Smittium megazygosporum]